MCEVILRIIFKDVRSETSHYLVRAANHGRRGGAAATIYEVGRDDSWEAADAAGGVGALVGVQVFRLNVATGG